MSEGSGARPTDASAAPAQTDERIEARLWRALGDDFSLMKDVTPPPRFPHARERMLMCRLYLGFIRTLSDDFGAPFAGTSDSASVRAIGIYVYFRTVMCAPVHASAVAQALKLPRAAALHGLQELIKHGYVERVGNAYRATEKANIPDLEGKMQARIDMIAATARELAALGTPKRGAAPGSPEPGEP